MVISLVGLILERLSSPKPNLSDLIEEELRTHLAQPLARDNIAQKYHMTGDHLNRILQRERGFGFVDMVHRVRIARVKEFLLTTPHSIEEIADLCGFGSPSYLIRVFRKQLGITPKKWQSLQREQGR